MFDNLTQTCRKSLCVMLVIPAVYALGLQGLLALAHNGQEEPTGQQEAPVNATSTTASSETKSVESNTPPELQLISSSAVKLKPCSTETANALLAARALDGIAIAPGAAFSFNATVGPRTNVRGYVCGAMFQNGQAITGLGGGICLTSTALYNAALEAGLPILQRSPHSAIVRYADPARDAAVAYPDMDLQFKNNTTAAIVIRTQAQDQELRVSIYGQKDPDRTVEVILSDYKVLRGESIVVQQPIMDGFEPVQVQTPRDGYEAVVIRKIKQNGKVVKREMISHDIHPAKDGITFMETDLPVTPPVEEPAITAPPAEGEDSAKTDAKPAASSTNQAVRTAVYLSSLLIGPGASPVRGQNSIRQ